MGACCFCNTLWHRPHPIISQALRFICGLIVLVAFQWFGELLVRWTGVIIPGPLVGMLLLLVVLIFSRQLNDLIQPTSSHLIQNLSLLFIPACVGAFFLSEQINLQLPKLLLAVIVSTPLTMILMTLLITSIKGNKDV
ncbi:MAG: CidA/LrgA family protein [Porticoccaceae bacterium]|nr:CidA/LrgA family protein [Porticoccaceae bacterium]